MMQYTGPKYYLIFATTEIGGFTNYLYSSKTSNYFIIFVKILRFDALTLCFQVPRPFIGLEKSTLLQVQTLS